MPDRIKTFLNTTYAKIALAGVLTAIGVTAGIYVGSALTGRESMRGDHTPTQSRVELQEIREQKWREAGIYLSFDVGDSFPLHEEASWEGNITTFGDLLSGKESVLIFIDHNCDRCLDLLSFWNDFVAPKLRRNVQVLVCADCEGGELPAKYVKLIKDKTLVLYDAANFAANYHVPIYPMIITVNSTGVVAHQQFGFAEEVEQQILDQVCNTKP